MKLNKLGMLFATITILASTAVQAKDHALNVTAINFLAGDRDNQNKKDLKVIVSDEDVNKRIVISKNSAVELAIISNKGTVTFEAKDANGLVLAAKDKVKPIILGETKEMIRFYPENSKGFSYLMVEEVSGISDEELKRLNAERSAESSKLHNFLLAEKARLGEEGFRKKYIDREEKVIDETALQEKPAPASEHKAKRK